MDLRILLAPDKFKGTLDAPSVAEAMAAGARVAAPGAEVRLRPLADGGEGTLDCIAAASQGTFTGVPAEDAFGAVVVARALDDGTSVLLAMHETARLPARPTAPGALRASSRGTGLAVRRALDSFPGREVVVFVGGSVSTDGGAGAAQAAGWRLLDAAGRDLGPGGGALRGLRRIVPPADPGTASVVAACDVDAPLLGPNGTAVVFAPQKGAGPSEVRVLKEGLGVLAERIEADLAIDVSSVAGGGAGGGMGAGLLAFFGASLVSAFDLVATATSFAEDVAWADLVVTGEGRVDESTLGGKVVARVAKACAAAGKRCAVVAGEVRLRAEALPPHETLGVAAVEDLVAAYGRERAFSDPARCVRDATTGLVGAAFPGG